MSQHNHITRDIKPKGECPACDEYHDRVKQETAPKPKCKSFFDNMHIYYGPEWDRTEPDKEKK